MNLLLVAYASPKWGFGHLNRCHVIAERAQQRGWDAKLLVRGPSGLIRERLSGSSILYEIIHEKTTLDQEMKMIDESRPLDRLVIDHPVIDDLYADLLAARKLPWLTFTHRDKWPGKPTWLVNTRPGLFVSRTTGGTRLLFGPEWAVLRAEFKIGCGTAYEPPKYNPRLFVTFGGGDDFGAGRALMSKLLESFPDWTIDVVTTSANSAVKEFEALANCNRRLNLYLEPEDMRAILCRASLALVSGGTTTYEVARCGIPLLIVALVDNQRRQARAWQDLGAGFYLGRVTERTLLSSAIGAINRLSSDSSLSERMHRVCKKTVDGCGVDRILDTLAQNP